MSSLPTDHVSAAWPPARAALLPRLGSLRNLRAGLGEGAVGERDAQLDLGFRFAAVQVGYWLGWASIVVVVAGLALDVGAQHRWLLLGATLAAAAANTTAMAIPWRDWLATRRGRLLLDLWCGGLIAFVALLVVDGGSNFSLLLFLAAPFIAVVQIGWRRSFWLAAVAATCSVVTALTPLSADATAMRLALVAATVAVSLGLVHAIRREAWAHRRAAASAEVERTLAREANHRIKNDLQTAADLLLLGRPDGPEGTRFDETAARIRSIATVHRLLTEANDRVDGAALLQRITAGAPVPITIHAEPGMFDAATAQKLGLVANELVTNAFRHGAPPIVVRLSRGAETHLYVEDSGGGIIQCAGGFGLDLVRSVVEQGLNGRFELHAPSMGCTRAEVVFPTVPT